jgi:acetyl-CoA carboxylase biotin carboxyl carrier protein
MSEPSSNPEDIFNVRKIRRLVRLMNNHDLTEVDLRQGETRIKLRRGAEPVVTYAAAPAPRPAGDVAEPRAGATPAAAAPTASEAHLLVIKSPMVGTFYKSSNPESPPFIKVGDHVANETVVCIIEAMKVFNEIPAEIAGKVVASLVENGEPVEFGQPLFKVDPRG